MRLVTECLSAEHREVLTAFLQADPVEAIAEQINRSPRTVRRLLASVRGQVERQLLDAHRGSTTDPIEIPPLEEPLPYSDFRLERLIGAGGMGKVYRATRLSTGETVAVKALRKDRQTEPRAVRQFLHEAEVVRRLDHPGVIRVRGLGRFPSGGYFLVMDSIDGDDLQSLIDRRPLPLAEALSIVERVTEAVAHTHQAGVVHCDLKPANILLSAGDDVVVTDFGFAQIIAGSASRAAIGGTPGYLAPELIASKHPPTPAADVYSLGRLLERLTTSMPETLQVVCSQCLAQDPALRPQSAEAFLQLVSDASRFR